MEPEKILWAIGIGILYIFLPIGVFIGLGFVGWGTIYWYNSGKYSR